MRSGGALLSGVSERARADRFSKGRSLTNKSPTPPLSRSAWSPAPLPQPTLTRRAIVARAHPRAKSAAPSKDTMPRRRREFEPSCPVLACLHAPGACLHAASAHQAVARQDGSVVFVVLESAPPSHKSGIGASPARRTPSHTPALTANGGPPLPSERPLGRGATAQRRYERGGQGRRRGAPPPSPGTSRTRRDPPPVLAGHVATLPRY
jgi:hypothetical protein